MQYDSVYHSPVEELIRRCCELAEYWLIVVRRELIRRTVGQYLIGRSTGDHGLQEEMVRRRGDHTVMVEQREGVVGCLRVYCAIIMAVYKRDGRG